jgi:hypothetical protein
MHEAKPVHVKHESDGAIAVLMRCCADATTDQWHTLQVQPETSDQEIQDWLASVKSRCEQQHATRERARVIIEQGIVR